MAHKGTTLWTLKEPSWNWARASSDHYPLVRPSTLTYFEGIQRFITLSKFDASYGHHTVLNLPHQW